MLLPFVIAILLPLTSYLSPLTYLCSRARKYGKKEVLQVLLEVITSWNSMFSGCILGAEKCYWMCYWKCYWRFSKKSTSFFKKSARFFKKSTRFFKKSTSFSSSIFSSTSGSTSVALLSAQNAPVKNCYSGCYLPSSTCSTSFPYIINTHIRARCLFLDE